MRFIATPIPGAFVIEPEEMSDERGFFARIDQNQAAAVDRLVVTKEPIGNHAVKAGRANRTRWVKGAGLCHPEEIVQTISGDHVRAFQLIVDAIGMQQRRQQFPAVLA